MPKVEIEGDVGVISAYAGAVSGILTAIGTPTNKGRFIGKYMDKTKAAFMTDSIAANEAGSDNIKHMFEWGETPGTTTDKPLFVLLKKGRGDTRYLTFDFLPSTQPVPVIDHGQFGTSAQLKPHIFRMKAFVMETMESVTIAPKNAKALFIPAADQPRGYLMTTKAVTVNPGGNSTGGFVAWWSSWFDTRAQGIIEESTKLTEDYLVKTGQTVIRNATTGQFASGEISTFGYADAAARTSELQMNAEIAAGYEYD